MLAACNAVVEPGLDLGHTLADFPQRIVRPSISPPNARYVPKMF
jgi:hypothetical protein